ncbi:MAG TPA: alcohol dehydrogenase catalytic domain-containing protein [Firmicutes bacterium]|nr:alcohol dehydrogenase catalytic domain-containing protein [Bacillota bacterium]
MEMKTARFLGNKKVALERKEKPKAGPGQVVIEVKACGLCGSERPQYLAGFHHHQGHEAAGVVSEIGDGVTNVKLGERVVGYLTGFCGECEACKAGLTTACQAYPEKENMGWAYPGGFAEYLLVDAQNALPLDDSLSFAEGVLLLDTLGTPYHGLRLAGAKKAKTAAVIGCGTVGLGTVIILKSLGVEKIFASDVSAYRLEKAAEFGAVAIDAAKHDVVEFIRENTANSGVDLVVEAVGRPATLEQAVKAARFGGTVLGLGEQPDEFKLQIDLEMRLKDLTFVRSWYFPVKEYYENMELMKDGFFQDINKLVTHTFPLEKMQKACDLFYGGETLKAIIKFS